jgi:hypothetical protein
VEYLLIAFPHGSGIWAAVLPDFVGVTGRARDLFGAIEQATAGAGLVLKALRAMPAPMPEPSDLAAAQRNFPWGQQYGIDWSKAVVNTVSLPSDNAAFEPARIGTRTGAGRPEIGARSRSASTLSISDYEVTFCPAP